MTLAPSSGAAHSPYLPVREVTMIRVTPLAIHAEHVVQAKINAEIPMDRVARDSADSFPASDPPSWTPLQVGSPIQGSPRDEGDR